MAQQQGVAQARLIFAAAGYACTGGGCLQRQAAPPHPSKWYVRPHAGIEQGERGAGPEHSFVDVGDRRIEPHPAVALPPADAGEEDVPRGDADRRDPWRNISFLNALNHH
jgi:hypothetical protein